jgi:hypothetical protein
MSSQKPHEEPNKPFAPVLPTYSLGVVAPPPKPQDQPPAPDPSDKAAPARSQTVTIRFSLFAPNARKVSVCGEFNDWEPDATSMQLGKDGRWEAAFALQPGRYRYKFVVDGEWLHDPNAQENEPNEHGSLNSVLQI